MKRLGFVFLLLVIVSTAVKISPAVLRSSGDIVSVIIYYNSLERIPSSVSTLKSTGDIVVSHVYKHVPVIFARIPKDKLILLENDRNIKYISTDVLYRPLLQDSVSIIRAVNISYNNISLNGSGIKVAVLDTGVDYTHPDLNGSVLLNESYDFVDDDNDPMDTDGHGTHIAGIIAAHGSLTGVAPGAKILAIRVCNSLGCYLSDILKGIDWALEHNADVVSLSLGTDPEYLPDGTNVLSMVLSYISNETIPVVAAGNSYMYGVISLPGDSQNIITVGATDKSDSLTEFSSKGLLPPGRAKPDLSAPGSDISSTHLNSTYVLMSGTSMATPHVSGAVALLLQAHPEWKGNTSFLRTVLKEGSDYLQGYYPSEVGSGRLNVSGSLNLPLLILPDEVDVSLYPGSTVLFNLTVKKLLSTNTTINVSITPARPINLVRCSTATYSFVSANYSNNITQNTSYIELNISVPNTTAPGYYEGYILVTPNGSKPIPIPYVVSVVGVTNTSFDVCGNMTISPDLLRYYDTFYVNLNLTTEYYRVFISLNSSPEYMYLTGPDGLVLNMSAGLNYSFVPWINGTYVLTVVPNKTIKINVVFEHRGLDVSPNSLHFLVHPIDSKTKNITVRNPFSGNVSVYVNYINVSTEHVSIQPSSFILSPNQTVNVSITLSTNDTTMFGRYIGDIVVVYNGSVSGQEELPLVFDIILPINLTYNFSVVNFWSYDIDFVNGFYIVQPINVNSYTITAQSLCYWSILLYDVNNTLVKNISISGNYPYTFKTLYPGVWYVSMFTDYINCSLDISVKGQYVPEITIMNASGQVQQAFLPGDSVTISYSAHSETGYSIQEPGILQIYLPNGTLYLLMNITIPSNYSFVIQNSSVPGNWTVEVVGSNYIYRNTTTFYVGQVPTAISIDVLPGVLVNSSIDITPKLFDHVGNIILNHTLLLNISLPNGTIESFNVSSNTSLTYTPSLVGRHTVTASYGNLSNTTVFMVDTLSRINLSVSDTYLEPFEPLNFTVMLLNSSGNISWIVRNISLILVDPNNQSWNHTAVIYGSGNVSIDLPEHPVSGNWTVTALDPDVNVSSNSVSFFVNVTFNYTVTNLFSQYNVSVSRVESVCFYVNNTGNDADNFSIAVQNLTWNYTISPQIFFLYPGNVTRICINITVPFVAAGTFENFSIMIFTEYYRLNRTYYVSLKVEPYIDFSVSANTTHFSGFNIPDSLSVNLTFENLGNQNITINCSFTQGEYVNPPLNFSVLVNMSQNTNITVQFGISVGAYDDESIRMSCSSANTVRNITFTFSPPRLTVSVNTPNVDIDNYPETGTVKVPVSVSYSGTSIGLGDLSQKTCIVENTDGENKTGTIGGSGTNIYCEFTNMDSWSEGEYNVYVEVRDNYNRTGKDTGTVFVPEDISGGSIYLDDSSVCTGESTVLRGRDFVYSSRYYVDGTVDVYVGSTKIGTYSVINGDFSVTVPGQRTPGSYIVKAIVRGVWGISAQVTRTLDVYNCSSTASDGGGGGGGGGGSTSEGPSISLENTPEITEYASFRNPLTYNLRIIGLMGNYSVNAREEDNYMRFDILFPEKVRLTGNDVLNITIRPFKYTKPGNYTVIVEIGSHEYRFTVNVPHPPINRSRINVFRYVEYYPQADITKMYIEVHNPLDEEKEIQIIENISKSIAQNVNQIIRFGDWYVIQEDPVLGYNLTLKPNETVYLRYNLIGNYVDANFSEPHLVTPSNITNQTQQNVTKNVSAGVLSGKISTPQSETENKTKTPEEPVPEKPADYTIWYVVMALLVFGGIITFLIFKGYKRWKKQEKPKEFQKIPETQERQEFPIDKLFEKP